MFSSDARGIYIYQVYLVIYQVRVTVFLAHTMSKARRNHYFECPKHIFEKPRILDRSSSRYITHN